MKRIAIVTSTRAEYGLLAPIVRELRRHEGDDFRAELVVTGTHLHEAFGMTVNEIYAQSVRIDHEIFVPVNSRTSEDISNNQAAVLVEFTRLFERERYSAVLILGDRYEILCVAMAAVNTHTPVFHISGGDVTEGAVDDCIRHSITKMSYLHFTTSNQSRKRVIQLGEDPSRVFNYGSTSIDNALNEAILTKEEAMNSISLNNPDYAICTYHPVTLESSGTEQNIHEFLKAIAKFPEIDFVVTKSNADKDGELINTILDSSDLPNLHVYSSLGVKRYLSLMKYSLFVLGNSSSGIVEAPAFHVPTVNIGDRQRGRLRASSVIDCEADEAAIVRAINRALSSEFRAECQNVISPYGGGHSAEKVSAKILEVLGEKIDLKKKFYDIEVRV